MVSVEVSASPVVEGSILDNINKTSVINSVVSSSGSFISNTVSVISSFFNSIQWDAIALTLAFLLGFVALGMVGYYLYKRQLSVKQRAIIFYEDNTFNDMIINDNNPQHFNIKYGKNVLTYLKDKKSLIHKRGIVSEPYWLYWWNNPNPLKIPENEGKLQFTSRDVNTIIESDIIAKIANPTIGLGFKLSRVMIYGLVGVGVILIGYVILKASGVDISKWLLGA